VSRAVVIAHARRALAHARSAPNIARAVHNALSEALAAPIWFFGVYDAAAHQVAVVWQMHCGRELPGGGFPLGSGFTSEVIRTRRPPLIRRWSNDGPRVAVQYATETPGLPQSSVTVPIVSADDVLGVISVQDYGPEAFDDGDLVLLQAAAHEAADPLRACQPAARFRDAFEEHTDGRDFISAQVSQPRLVIDGQGQLVQLNQAARQLLDTYGESITLGQPLDALRDIAPAHQRPSLVQALGLVVARLKRGEVKPDTELAESQRPITIRARPVRSDNGAAVGGVITITSEDAA
jgi:PAS domain-containing protein